MSRRRSNLDHLTHAAEEMRRLIANETEKKERASTSEKDKEWFEWEQNDVQPDLRMFSYQHVDCVLQLQICFVLNRMSAAGGLGVVERIQQEQEISVEHIRVQQSRDYNRLAFDVTQLMILVRAENVLICTITEVCPYCKVLKFNGETKGICCAAGKIKVPQLGEPSEPLRTLLAGFTADSKPFPSVVRKYNS